MTSIGLTVAGEFAEVGNAERSAAFVARLKPPSAPRVRAGLRIVLGLDTSGSMAYGRLESAVESACALVQTLGSHDTFACVTFDSVASVLIPPMSMTGAGKELVRERLRRTGAEGGTDLAAGMLRTLEIAGALPRAGRALLLTDGCPTQGVLDPTQILKLAHGASKRATLSTFGFGREVDPRLLQALAETGRGNYTFIESSEPPMAAIGAELGGLLMTVAADVTLTIAPAAGVRVTRVYKTGRIVVDSVTGATRIGLNPLVADEAVHVAFELSWSDDAVRRPLALLALSARLTETGEPISCETNVGIFIRETHRGSAYRASGLGRGTRDRAASKEILLARAAIALYQAAEATHRPPRDIAVELARHQAALEQAARAAELDGDEQVRATFEMLTAAREGLEAAGAHAVHWARQDLVASATAVSQRRSAMFSEGSLQDAFTSPSQRLGRALLDHLWKEQQQPSPRVSPSDSKPSSSQPR